MKKIIPVLIAIVLIFLIVGISFGSKIMERYSYSKEEADLNEYFGVTGDEAAIMMQDEIIEDKARVGADGTFYITYDTVSDYFIYTRLYVNETENSIRYVLPDRILSYNIGESSYMDGENENLCDYQIAFYEGDTLYIAIDFIRLFTVFDYETFREPNHIQIYTSHSERQVAEITKDTQVRYQGGVKSEILKEVIKGDQVIVLDQMETWSKVKTTDGLIGYVENKKLGEMKSMTPSFVNNSSMYGDLEFTNISKDYKINMGWHQIFGSAGNGTLTEVTARTKGLNTISPTWFHLSGNEGGIVSYASQNYVDTAHAMGLEVWALADDFTEEVDRYAIFSSSAVRAVLIQNLMTEVLTYGIDGLNIDFEKIDEATGKHFVEFIRELSIECRKNGIVLSVDNYPISGGKIWYNRREQSAYADYVIVMGYDEHWSTSTTAGSVASIDYVDRGIADTLEYVPAEKLINGIPFYTRIWSTTGTGVSGEAYGMQAAADFVKNNNIQTQWLDKECQHYGEIQKNDTLYQVWLEDYDSVKVKLDVMKTYDLAGVAGWKLGLESADIWDLIAEYCAN
ncbi:MAG: SH3 domain-containing protein [Lachnospiraceae bacterium]|nr:SH3 domain-containing protein [Lachnospiraceae bacterium]